MKSGTSHDRLWLIGLSIVALYFFTRLFLLHNFPVFADEAIYIRWGQLILDDWQQYLFFPLNDGKTPLFIWMISLTQWIVSDQLLAARLLSVGAGLAQVWIVGKILQQLGARKTTQYVGMLLVVGLPFWLIYHRMALMDSWLTVWLSLTFSVALSLRFLPVSWQCWSWSRVIWLRTLLLGLGLGISLWTKLPALFFLPIIAWVPLYTVLQRTSEQKYASKDLARFLPYMFGALFGLALLGVLKLSPAFGQLFARGQDFTFSISELISGKWVEVFPQSLRFFGVFLHYLSWPILVLLAIGFFAKSVQKRIFFLIVCSVLFLLPFLLLGRVVHARYLLPAALFFTIAAALSAEALTLKLERTKQLLPRALGSLIFALFVGQVVLTSSVFFFTLSLSPNSTPFIEKDREQYLEEWSSGHGIRETVALISTLTTDQRVAVATEGRFGTLPDGLLLFFHHRPVENLYLEGIGQFPVVSIPDDFVRRAATARQSLLVVNSHRMKIPLPPEALLAEYCRPRNAPCLQVWDITTYVAERTRILSQ